MRLLHSAHCLQYSHVSHLRVCPAADGAGGDEGETEDEKFAFVMKR
jgi:hypothetical protein